MGLHVAALLVHNATQLALHRFERVVNHLVKRLMGAVVLLLFIGDHFVPACDSHVDSASVGVTFLMGVIGLLNRYITAVDVVAKFFESRGVIQNEISDLVRFFQTPIRDLNWQLHDYLESKVLHRVEGTKIFDVSCVHIGCNERNRETSFAGSTFTKSDFTCSTIRSRTAAGRKATIAP